MIEADRAVLVAIAIVGLVLLVALGLWAMIHGLRGPLVVCRPRCGRCRHELGGTVDDVPPREICPECGAALGDPGAVVHAMRTRRPRVAASGVLLLVVMGAIAGFGRGAVVPTPRAIAAPPNPPRLRPPVVAPAPWPPVLAAKDLERYRRVLSQAPDAVILASARDGLADRHGWLTEVVARVNDGALTRAELVPVLREALEQTGLTACPFGLWPYDDWDWTTTVMPDWLREELIWASLGPPLVVVPHAGDGSVPIRVFGRRRFGRGQWTESPLVVHSVRLVGDGLDLALNEIPERSHHFALGPMVPRGTYEVRVDLERTASARSSTSGTLRRRSTVSRSFELLPPGAPLARMAPDPALVAAVREAYREAIVVHRRREGRPDFLHILAVERSFGDVVPVHPAIFRVDVLIGDARVGADLTVLGPTPISHDGGLRGALDRRALPDPLPETVTIELRPGPEFIDDVGLRAPVIAGDTIRIEDVPLFVNPGPRWLPN